MIILDSFMQENAFYALTCFIRPSMSIKWQKNRKNVTYIFPRFLLYIASYFNRNFRVENHLLLSSKSKILVQMLHHHKNQSPLYLPLVTFVHTLKMRIIHIALIVKITTSISSSLVVMASTAIEAHNILKLTAY